jgi:XTP/dITP diphosphohydrolase
MTTEIIFATHNQNKVEEIAAMLPKGFVVKSLKDHSYHQEIPETSNTLEGNAWIKANTIFEALGESVFSDDTGLEVEALNGAPGVLSARYAGPQKSADDNMDKLLQELSNKSNRKARFRTAIALILDGEKHLFEGVVNGKISLHKAGTAGFGYDPIFIPEGYDISFAEMSADLKNTLSHRGRAFRKMIDFLKDHS